MSITIPTEALLDNPPDDSDSGSTTSEEETFDDWTEEPTPCYSLFEDPASAKPLLSAAKALEHDQKTYGFDLIKFSEKLALDFYGRARLINYIRGNKVAPAALQNLSGKESFLSDDALLKPVVEDDPLLQIETDHWSDDDEPDKIKKSDVSSAKSTEPNETAKFEQLKHIVQELVGSSSDDSGSKPTSSELAGEQPARDDDSHYFESYGFQEIHAIMLQDSVRTSSYAKFLLSNPQLFRDKLVMDVGCGTGILSMFAARAGARHVFAIDASDIALKARQNVKDNGLEDVITVIQGKVERVKLPAPYDDPSVKMDVIVSEWMGYALLYESMLDSVLVARDRWLKPAPQANSSIGGGVMAPSQCRMVLTLAETPDIVKDKLTFWQEVYGFKMTAMAEDAHKEALIEQLKPEAVISNLVTIKDLPLQRITARQLDFSQSFKLTSTKQGVVHAFLLYFDTWFMPDGADVPSDAQPTLHEAEGNFVTAEVVQIGGRGPKEKDKKPTEVSFSTGPASLCTHWKQTVFLLRESFKVIEGTTVTGTFHCKKSPENSRELDVEVHYAVSHTGVGVGPTIVQMWKVR